MNLVEGLQSTDEEGYRGTDDATLRAYEHLAKAFANDLDAQPPVGTIGVSIVQTSLDHANQARFDCGYQLLLGQSQQARALQEPVRGCVSDLEYHAAAKAPAIASGNGPFCAGGRPRLTSDSF
jgi:hypothetical protein